VEKTSASKMPAHRRVSLWGIPSSDPYLGTQRTLAGSQLRIMGSGDVYCHPHGFCGTILGPMEHTFTCPSCGEEISMVLDLSVSRHTYIEDCEVCCTPIEISYTVQDDALASFDAKTLE
jgi:Cysteine-rich CPXCG